MELNLVAGGTLRVELDEESAEGEKQSPVCDATSTLPSSLLLEGAAPLPSCVLTVLEVNSRGTSGKHWRWRSSTGSDVAEGREVLVRLEDRDCSTN